MIAIVTGGGRGIGAATARVLAGSGYDVAISYRSDSASAGEIVRDIEGMGRRALAMRADNASEQDILSLFRKVDNELGPVSVLVNNAAATGGFARIEDVTVESLNAVAQTNFVGTAVCCREAVRRMSTKHGGAGGVIVNISSGAAIRGSAGEWVHYAASKGAVNTLTIGLAKEVALEGIRVNAVAPGLTATDMHANEGAPDRLERMAPMVPMGRAGTAEEVAAAVAWLASDAASYVTGAILPVGGGF